MVLPIFEVPDPKSEVPNAGISYVRCFLLLCSYLYVFPSPCYSKNGVAPSRIRHSSSHAGLQKLWPAGQRLVKIFSIFEDFFGFKDFKFKD